MCVHADSGLVSTAMTYFTMSHRRNELRARSLYHSVFRFWHSMLNFLIRIKNGGINNNKKTLEYGGVTHLWLFEDISGDGVEVSQVFDGGDVLRHGLDHHLTGRQHQLMGSHLRQKHYLTFYLIEVKKHTLLLGVQLISQSTDKEVIQSLDSRWTGSLKLQVDVLPYNVIWYNDLTLWKVCCMFWLSKYSPASNIKKKKRERSTQWRSAHSTDVH